MARPVDPDSGFRVKIHDNGGHRYASTQPAFTDPVTGRKKYRRLHWGVVCILRAPAVADALTTGRGAVIERSAGGAGQDCL